MGGSGMEWVEMGTPPLFSQLFKTLNYLMHNINWLVMALILVIAWGFWQFTDLGED